MSEWAAGHDIPIHSQDCPFSTKHSLSLFLSSTTKSLIGLGCCGKEGTGCVFYLDTIPLRSRKFNFFCGLFVVLADTDFSCFVFCIFFDMNLHLHPILWRISTRKKTMNANNMYCKNNKNSQAICIGHSYPKWQKHPSRLHQAAVIFCQFRLAIDYNLCTTKYFLLTLNLVKT